MLDIGFSEILLIFVLGLIVLGPEKLPRVAAQVGRWIGRARAMARQFREQLEEEVTVEETRKKTAKASGASTTKDGEAGGSGEGPAGGSTSGTAAGGTETGSGAAGGTGSPSPGTGSSASDHATGTGSSVPESQDSAPTAEVPHQDLTNEPWPYVSPAPPPEVSDIFHDVLKTPVPGAATVQSSAGASEGAAGTARAVPPESASSARVQWAHDHEFSEATTEEVSSEAPPTTHEREP